MSAIPHIEMIVGAYGVAALVVALMIAWVWLDYRALNAALARLDQNRGRNT